MQATPTACPPNRLDAKSQLLHLRNIDYTPAIEHPLRLLHSIRDSRPLDILACDHLFHTTALAVAAPFRAGRLGQVTLLGTVGGGWSKRRVGFEGLLLLLLALHGHVKDVELRERAGEHYGSGAVQLRRSVGFAECRILLCECWIVELVPFREDQNGAGVGRGVIRVFVDFVRVSGV
jgi:hypothetical protein